MSNITISMDLYTMNGITIKIKGLAALVLIEIIFGISFGFVGSALYMSYPRLFGTTVPTTFLSADIANNFIVFTTFIFIAITTLTTISGFILMHKLSQSEEKAILATRDKLVEHIKHSDKVEDIVKAITTNTNINGMLVGYITSLINEKTRDGTINLSMTLSMNEKKEQTT